MTYTGSTYGASTAKTLEPDIYEVLREIMDDHPKANKSRLRKLYVDAVKNDPDLNDAFIEAFFENVLAVLTRARSKSKKRKRMMREEKQKQQAKHIDRFVMSYVMPNGKPLKECTFGEVATFGARFSKLSAMGKPDEIVGQVLSQKQVREALLK
jgi:hypothetical protein